MSKLFAANLTKNESENGQNSLSNEVNAENSSMENVYVAIEMDYACIGIGVYDSFLAELSVYSTKSTSTEDARLVFHRIFNYYLYKLHLVYYKSDSSKSTKCDSCVVKICVE